jgi:hypothetical protein
MHAMAKIACRVPGFVLLLSILCDCGPKITPNRALEASQDRTNHARYVPEDPEEYDVEGYGVIRLHGKTVPPCPFDTVATVVTSARESYEAALTDLLLLVVQHRGRAAIRCEPETLAVSEIGGTAPRTASRIDRNGKVTRWTVPGGVRNSAVGLKYRYRGIVVRYQNVECGSKN